MAAETKTPKSKKARRTLLLCLLALAVCLAAGIGLKIHADNVAAAKAEAARIAAEEAAAEAQRQAEEAAAEAERLAREEAERQAAEEAARAEQELAEQRQQALAEAAALKENVQYGDHIGTVWIEGTNVNCGLYWGDSTGIMDVGAGCSADNGCVLPGENGTVFIGAHTGSYFADLGSTQMGAIVHLDTLWGDYQYQVTDLKVILETDVDQCRWGDTEPNCILYTCYPFGILVHTTQRYLVYAEPLNTDENGVIPASVPDAQAESEAATPAA